MQVHYRPCRIPGGAQVVMMIAVAVATAVATLALGTPSALACPAPAPDSFGRSPAYSSQYVLVSGSDLPAPGGESWAPELRISGPVPAAPVPGPERAVPTVVAPTGRLSESAVAGGPPSPSGAEYVQVTSERIPFEVCVIAIDDGPRGTPVGSRSTNLVDGFGAGAACPAGPTNALREDLCRIYGGRVEIDPGKASLLALAGGAVMLVDRDLYDRINSGPRDPRMDRLGDVITDLGTGVATLGISGLVALGDPETGYLAANAVVYSGLSCAILKAAFGRARPGLGQGPYSFAGPCIREGYNSMPSGHSAAAFALATVLARQYPKYRVFFYAGATLVAISRVYEHAHWPSDTLVGAAIGIWSANQVMGRSRLFEITW